MSEKTPPTVQGQVLEYDEKYWTDIVFQWADSNFDILDSNGLVTKAGTILRIRNKIEFLHHLTEEQLLQLKSAVSESVDYELHKRKSKQ